MIPITVRRKMLVNHLVQAHELTKELFEHAQSKEGLSEKDAATSWVLSPHKNHLTEILRLARGL